MSSGSAFLDHITAAKRDQMAAVSREARMAMRSRATAAVAGRAQHAFAAELNRTDRANIIAEVKRSSPSAGAIRMEADAASAALRYEQSGAAAISVLTEPEYFKGSLQDLESVTSKVRVPVLRKDFTVDSHQIYEAAASGASAILLIVAALSVTELRELRAVAEEELGLDSLVEAHTAKEIEAALEAGAPIIGVNNRNLRTLEVRLQTSHELARYIEQGKTFISESGIKTPADVAGLRSAGYRGFLVGETLMRADDPAAALRALAQGASQ